MNWHERALPSQPGARPVSQPPISEAEPLPLMFGLYIKSGPLAISHLLIKLGYVTISHLLILHLEPPVCMERSK